MCATAMDVGMRAMTLQHALILHAFVAPLIFGVISFSYFRRPNAWSPLLTARLFLTTAAVLDAFIVALIVRRSFAMFASILGVYCLFYSSL